MARIGINAEGAGVGVWFGKAETRERTYDNEGTAGGVNASIKMSIGIVSSGAAGEEARVVASVPLRRKGNGPSDVCARGRGRLAP